ncbi:MAG: AraC family transcriptional regulator [Verrucomicrobiota bacterium]
MSDAWNEIEAIEREVYHRFVDGEKKGGLISTGFHVGLPEMSTRKEGAAQPEYSISYILKGEGSFRDSEGKTYRFKPGSVVQRYPEREYGIHREEAFDHVEFFMIIPDSLFESFASTGIIRMEPSVFDAGIDLGFVKRLLSFVGMFRNSSDGETRSVLMDTIPLIIDSFRREALLDRDTGETSLIDRACEMLSGNLGEKLKLEEVAQELGLSYESFRKKFREYKDISPAQFRIQKRLEYAMELLIEDRMQIKEIAFELGYANTAAFAKIFQKGTGQAPAVFRSEYRKRVERNL